MSQEVQVAGSPAHLAQRPSSRRLLMRASAMGFSRHNETLKRVSGTTLAFQHILCKGRHELERMAGASRRRPPHPHLGETSEIPIFVLGQFCFPYSLLFFVHILGLGQMFHSKLLFVLNPVVKWVLHKEKKIKLPNNG